jgi:UPF0288 family protein (methanogenesis marker protein 3)
MHGSQLNVHHTVSRKAAGSSVSIRHEYSVGKNGKLKPSSYTSSFVADTSVKKEEVEQINERYDNMDHG